MRSKNEILWAEAGSLAFNMSDSETNLLNFDLGISNYLASLAAARQRR
jgi:hypothetical protein